MRNANDLSLLLIRACFGATLALQHGLGKMMDLERFTGAVARHGFPVPEFFAGVAALSEFAGGLLLAAGLLTRPAALSVMTTMLVAAFFIHAGDPFGRRELALAYAVGSAAVLLAGPGRYSVDGWVAARRKPAGAPDHDGP